ncbi:isoflavone reductase [Exidia glandulosa HHB12029]|uniref:Isoflavone reductase n=1 Tax=Exidia glandulosa HHB12029 TaxID=1314781 RepID=A0A165D3V1_EXIGL|nr:isoflavone reductase [Exidia glandulosa HHB12029]
MTSILVLGAGELGEAVVHHLARHPGRPAQTTISILLRPSTIESPSPHHVPVIQQFRDLAVSLVPGDIASLDVDALAEILAKHDIVISCTGFTAGPGSQIKLAQAALRAGVKRYFPWQFGVDYDTIGRGSAQTLFDEQLDVRDLLRAQSKTRWTIVSTGIFTSFLFNVFGLLEPQSDGSVAVHALGSLENKVTATTADDIGRMTAEAVYDDLEGVIFIAGDTISYAQFADIVASVTGRRILQDVWEVSTLRERLRKAPEDNLAKYAVVFAEGKGVAWDESNTLNAKKAIHLETAMEWARRNLKV